MDLDDTVFDHSMTCRAAIARLRRTEAYLGRRPLVGLWRDYLHLLDQVSPDVLSGKTSVAEARVERWRRLAATCGVRLAREDAQRLSASYRAHYQSLRRLVPGARELLAALHRHVSVVVVTNNEVAEQEEKVRFLGIGPLIDGLVVSEAVGAAKPDRRIFDVALSTAGVRPDEATMLGDSWTSDVMGATGAGIRPVWFNRFGLPRPGDTPTSELRSLRPAGAAQDVLLGHAKRAREPPPAPGASEL